MNDNSINIEVKNVLDDILEKIDVKKEVKKNYLLTMKISIDENNINEVYIPEDVKIDKILNISRDKYLDEINNIKKKEIDNLKNEIREMNSKKMESMFKNIMSSYNEKLDTKIDNIFQEDKNNVDIVSSDTRSEKSIGSDPFVMDYNLNNEENLLKDNRKKEKKNEKVNNKIKEKASDKLNKFFNCIYVINLPNERHKIVNLEKHLNKINAKYKIIDGVNVRDFENLKLYRRWIYQQNFDDGLVNKLIFDEKLYLKKNEDLAGKFKNKTQSFNHWFKQGKHEGRKLFEKTNIQIEPQLGNLIAHMNVLKDAMKNEYEKILVLEDDVYPHTNLEELHEDNIKKVKNFDILYYGCIQKKWDNININDGYYKADNSYGSFSYAIKSNIYELLLSMYEELVNPVEKCLIEIQSMSNRSYVFYPNLFITDLENGKIHRKREFDKYSKHFKWDINSYVIIDK